VSVPQGGKLPIVVDTSPCLSQIKAGISEPGLRFALYEPVEFIRHFLVDKLEFSKVCVGGGVWRGGGGVYVGWDLTVDLICWGGGCCDVKGRLVCGVSAELVTQVPVCFCCEPNRKTRTLPPTFAANDSST